MALSTVQQILTTIILSCCISYVFISFEKFKKTPPSVSFFSLKNEVAEPYNKFFQYRNDFEEKRNKVLRTIEERMQEKMNVSGILKHKNFYFTILERNICANSTEYQLLIVVHTAPEHFLKRKRIRDTWGSLYARNELNFALVFTLGLSQDFRVSQKLKRESNVYHDMIQEDFVDAYRNLTYKAIMWLRWSAKLADKNPKVPKIYCAVWKGMKVERDPRSKWFVRPQDYPNDHYSEYCSGAAYILSDNLVRGMYKRTFVEKLFWIDDFYVTGLLPKRLKAEYVDIVQFYGFFSFNKLSREKLLKGELIFQHLIWSTHLYMEYWRLLLDKHRGIEKRITLTRLE